MKKVLAMLLVAALLVSVVACNKKEEQKETTAKQETTKKEETKKEETKKEETTASTEEEYPALKILTGYQSFGDMNEDPAYQIMVNATGWDNITFEHLPAENGDEKLMLMIASKEQFDGMTTMYSANTFSQLLSKGALYDLTDIIAEYGQDIYCSDFSWKAVTDENGRIFAIPRDAVTDCLPYGIGFRSDKLEELGMELPTNLEDFYNVLVAYKEATGNVPMTANSAWNKNIASAFGLADCTWYYVDGEVTPKVKAEGYEEYIAFMQKLYREGLIDNDLPINTGDNCKEKFTNGTCLCMDLAFWDIPGIKEALAASNPDCKVLFAASLAKDANSVGLATTAYGVGSYNYVPAYASEESAIAFVKWYNLRSKYYKEIYIGEEGVSYEIKDGSYYPIFPAFNDYVNSDKYVGSIDGVEANKQWQARARKTPEMAEAFNAMNANYADYDKQCNYESCMSSDPVIAEYSSSLSQAVNDVLVQGVCGDEDAATVVKKSIEVWEENGGLESEEAAKAFFETYGSVLPNIGNE